MDLSERLTRILGKENVIIDTSGFSTDRTGIPGKPDAVVMVKDEGILEEVIGFSRSEKIPITPQGALTGYSGGAVPLSGIALSFKKMDKILEIDTDNLFAVVEPGVVNRKIREEVEKLGLFYPPDPASLDESTIGGNVGENASGPLSYKYGSTRDYVKGMRLYFMNGTVLDYGGKILKNEAGYNMLGFMVGSEGTLAIWTRIYLRLIPLPERRALIYSIFSSFEDAGRAIVEAHRSYARPSTLEIMDGPSLKAVESHLGVSLPGRAVVYAGIDGLEGDVKSREKVLRDIMVKCGAVEVEVAWEDKMEDLWKIRRELSPALEKLRRNKINEDVVVPVSKLPGFIAFLENLSLKKGVIIATFGHAGQGNLHVNILFDEYGSEEYKRARSALFEMMDFVVSCGGSITGEHGVGLAKKEFMGRMFGGSLEIMKKLKNSYDPLNLLNPGKIFP